MATDLYKLQVKLEAESAQLRSELDKTNQKLSRFERGATKSMQGFSRAAKAAFGVLSAGALIAVTKSAFDFADGIQDAADKAGLSTTALQELRFAAGQSGVDLRQLDDGIRRLTRRLGEFANSGGGPAAKAFKELNIAIKDVDGNVRPTEAVFNDVVKAMEGIESQAKRSAFAAQLFGDDAGPQLELLLRKGSSGLQDLRDAAQDVGAVLSEDVIKNAGDAKDKLDSLTTVIGVQLSTALVELAPALISAADLFLDFSKAVRLSFGDVENFTASLVKESIANLSQYEKELSSQLARAEEIADSRALKDTIERAFSPDPETIRANLDEVRLKIEQSYGRLGELNLGTLDAPKGPALDFTFDDPEAEKARKAYEKSLQSLLDKLDPVAAETREYTESVKLLDDALAKGDISGQIYDKMLVQLGTDTEALKKDQEEYEKSLTSLVDKLDPAAAKTREYMESVELLNRAFVAGDISPEQYEKLIDNLAVGPDKIKAMEDLLKSTLDAVDPAAALKRELKEVEALLQTDAGAEYGDEIRQRMEDLQHEIKNVGNEMSVFAEQAARNMQDHLADFLFDPFDKGLDGMVKGFAQAMQRMLAEAAAAQLFDTLGFGKGGGKGASGLGGAFWDFVGSFATGTDYVPKTGLALIHQGERIVPAAQNRQGGVTNATNYNVSVNVPPGSPADTRRAAAQGAREGVDAMRRAQRYA